MPKGNFDMDDFKRFYSNNDEDKSIPYFWDKFDKENYSIWRCDYKYSDELALVFMSCNLIGGISFNIFNNYCQYMKQLALRLEQYFRLRKQSFKPLKFYIAYLFFPYPIHIRTNAFGTLKFEVGRVPET
jgi:hypothetical protein